MKSLIFMLLAVISFISVTAQTNQNLYLRNSNNNLFRYGKQAVITTTDATEHTVMTFSPSDTSAGILEVSAIALDTVSGAVYSAIYTISYRADGDTVILLQQDTTYKPTYNGSALDGASVTFASSSGNLLVRVNAGDAAAKTKWTVNARWLFKNEED